MTYRETKISKLPLFFYTTTVKDPEYYRAKITHYFKAQDKQDDVYLLRNFDPNSKAATRLFVMMGRPSGFKDLFVNVEDIKDFVPPDISKVKGTARVYDHRENKFKRTKVPGVHHTNVYWVDTYNNHPVEKYDENADDKFRSNLDMQTFVKALKALNLLPTNSAIVGIPASWRDKGLEVPAAWNSFYDLVSQIKVPDIIDDKECANYYLFRHVCSEPSHINYMRVNEIQANDFEEGSELNKLLKFYEVTEPNNYHDWRNAINLCRLLNKYETPPCIDDKAIDEMSAKQTEFQELYRRMCKRYPLFNIITSRPIGGREVQRQMFLDYITMVDRNLASAGENDLVWDCYT